MAMSWEEGAQSYGLYDIQQIQDQNELVVSFSRNPIIHWN